MTGCKHMTMTACVLRPQQCSTRSCAGAHSACLQQCRAVLCHADWLFAEPCCAVLCFCVLCCTCVMQVVEAALGLLPFSEKTIITPTGQQLTTYVCQHTTLCGILAGLLATVVPHLSWAFFTVCRQRMSGCSCCFVPAWPSPVYRKHTCFVCIMLLSKEPIVGL